MPGVSSPIVSESDSFVSDNNNRQDSGKLLSPLKVPDSDVKDVESVNFAAWLKTVPVAYSSLAEFHVISLFFFLFYLTGNIPKRMKSLRISLCLLVLTIKLMPGRPTDRL